MPESTIISELDGYWDKVLMAVMRKYNLPEVKILPEDFEFMLPPYSNNGGEQPCIAAIGLRDVRERGGFLVWLCKNRVDAAARMAEYQQAHHRVVPKPSDIK